MFVDCAVSSSGLYLEFKFWKGGGVIINNTTEGGGRGCAPSCAKRENEGILRLTEYTKA